MEDSESLLELLSDIRYINTMILNTHRAMINTLKSEA